ncbi:hypothetical protein I8D64_09200 [Brachybacterium sp. MASK1Z-5]|uniref:DUF3352 domain-containing protein n=1 Tax=Brachybacterium halotolerans TaxID=2795215 RepID=A0ABS1BA86_9MICO|nr:hypothetical protein [Brachybacterium halotolerans]MBK0331579.1 hypothetical protein [Brachybacterium halotolerans]
MRRRALLPLLPLAVGTMLLAACGNSDPEETEMDAETVLDAAGLSAPDLEASVADAPLKGDEAWSRVVTFSGPADVIDAWVADNFPDGIESRAFKDDMAAATERLGDDTQKKGDRIAEGVEGSAAFVVVVGQEDEPVVHVAVRQTGR